MFIEEQTAQWHKEKVQKDKQRSTKHTHKTKDRVTRIPLKTGGELKCSGRIGSSCYTSCTSHVNLVTNPVISYEWGKDREGVYDKWNISVVICDMITLCNRFRMCMRVGILLTLGIYLHDCIISVREGVRGA